MAGWLRRETHNLTIVGSNPPQCGGFSFLTRSCTPAGRRLTWHPPIVWSLNEERTHLDPRDDSSCIHSREVRLRELTIPVGGSKLCLEPESVKESDCGGRLPGRTSRELRVLGSDQFLGRWAGGPDLSVTGWPRLYVYSTRKPAAEVGTPRPCFSYKACWPAIGEDEKIVAGARYISNLPLSWCLHHLEKQPRRHKNLKKKKLYYLYLAANYSTILYYNYNSKPILQHAGLYE